MAGRHRTGRRHAHRACSLRARFRAPCQLVTPHPATNAAPAGDGRTVRTGGTWRAGTAPPVRTVRAYSPRARFRAPWQLVSRTTQPTTPHRPATAAPCGREERGGSAPRLQSAPCVRTHPCAVPRTVAACNAAPSHQRRTSRRQPHRADGRNVAGRHRASSPHRACLLTPCAVPRTVAACNAAPSHQRRTSRRRPHRADGRNAGDGTAPPARTVRTCSPRARFRAPWQLVTPHPATNAAPADDSRTVRTTGPWRAGTTPPGRHVTGRARRHAGRAQTSSRIPATTAATAIASAMSSSTRCTV